MSPTSEALGRKGTPCVVCTWEDKECHEIYVQRTSGAASGEGRKLPPRPTQHRLKPEIVAALNVKEEQ